MPDRRGSAMAIAWGGAVMFAASLLWFLYCYFVRFDRLPASEAATSALAVDLLLFSIFALHHSVLARTAAKRIVQRLVPPAIERSLYTWVASLLFILVCTEWRAVPGVLYTLDGVGRVLAYGVQGLGIALTIQASRALDVLDLAGVRQAQQAGHVRTAALQTGGLYGFVRHPLYFSWVLLVFGAPDMTATRFVFAAVSTGYLALAIPWEERALVSAFGQEYVAYRAAVRWRMIPLVY